MWAELWWVVASSHLPLCGMMSCQHAAAGLDARSAVVLMECMANLAAQGHVVLATVRFIAPMHRACTKRTVHCLPAALCCP